MQTPLPAPIQISEILSHQTRLEEDSRYQSLHDLLRAVRHHLNMDVAFISEFTEGQRIFRHVDSAHENAPIQEGDGDPLEESYCQRIVDGRLPQLITDASQLPVARALPVTAALPVGAHLSIPIQRSDGTVYGTLCCFSFRPDSTLNERDLSILRMCSELAGKQIERQHEKEKHHNEMSARIDIALASDDPRIVYQPIHSLRLERMVGVESLARFATPPARTPDIWFSEAGQVGKLVELEHKTILKALGGLVHLDESLYLSVNISPETTVSGEIERLFENMPLNRIVLEITEHAVVSAYAEIASALRPLRDRGLRLAVDDAGAGYASFRHILALKPDIIKLDMSLTRDIDSDGSKRALASAFVEFAKNTQSEIVAEGVQTNSELRMLRTLGVANAQGYVLGKPQSLEGITEYLPTLRRTCTAL